MTRKADRRRLRREAPRRPVTCVEKSEREGVWAPADSESLIVRSRLAGAWEEKLALAHAQLGSASRPLWGSANHFAARPVG